MVQVNLKELVGKLNDTCRNALEGAAGSCLARTNYNIEIEHWLIKLIEAPNADLPAMLRYFELDAARVVADLTAAMDRFKTGCARPPALSPNVVDWIRTAWLIGSIDDGQRTIRSGHLLCALLSDEGLASAAVASAKDLDRVLPDQLRKELRVITSGSVETNLPIEHKELGAAGTTALGRLTVDLTAQVREGNMAPVLCRDAEIRQVIDVLCRRRQNNPILVGEAGVGKTSIAEGFAARVVRGQVPAALRHAVVRSLLPGLLQAWVAGKSDLENRWKSLVDEIALAPTPIILFLDDAHTLLGASETAAKAELANWIKSALARGDLRAIAATTWFEYKRHFENDATLAKSFQIVKVDEPDEATSVTMLQGNITALEKHHDVSIVNEAIVEAVRLSHRYISGRQLPEKAMSLLDTTCARVGLSQSATPPAVEDCERQIELLHVSMDALRRDGMTVTKNNESMVDLERHSEQLAAQCKELQARWQSELELVARIQRLRSDLQTCPPANDAFRGSLREELADVERKLEEVQRGRPLVRAYVDAASIAETVSRWTGIPVGRVVADEVNTVLRLQELMEQSIIGQSQALHRIAQSIRASRANLRDPCTPIGVFLLAGSSGVGKTETAMTLAQLLYGGEQNMTVINMSEFKEEHKISLLTGSPPGYVGYGQGGVLTEAVRRKPHSVVLLDEFEKAHASVQDIFYQVFDKGTLRDGEGRDVDFRNTIILMTTNAGAEVIRRLSVDVPSCPDLDAVLAAIFPELLRWFKPAFLGRVAIVPFYPLSNEVLRKIIDLKLLKVGKRVRDHYNAPFSYGPDVVEAIARRCTEADTGARNVDHILSRSLLPQLATEFLSRMAAGQPIGSVDVSVQKDGTFGYNIR